MTTVSDPLGAGMAALQARDMPRAAELLRRAAQSIPASAMPWVALANAELALGQSSAAEQAIDRQLEQAFRDVGALLLKGLLRERAGDARAAVSFYRTAIGQVAVGSEVPHALEQLMAHARNFVSEANRDFSSFLARRLGQGLSPTMTEAFELLTGQRELYFQQPSVFYYPGLAQRRFFEPHEFPWLSKMLVLLPAMQEELAAVLADGASGFDPYVRRQAHRPAPNNPLLDDDAWSAFHFWRDGAIDQGNAGRCPATMAALALAPMPRIVGRAPNAHWSRLKPGAHIIPHAGMLNCRLICHIPILTASNCTLRVGSETRIWESGRPLIFDDSIEHEARNEGTSERVVLLFEVWRPEIPEEDRNTITRMLEAIGEYGLDS